MPEHSTHSWPVVVLLKGSDIEETLQILYRHVGYNQQLQSYPVLYCLRLDKIYSSITYN